MTILRRVAALSGTCPLLHWTLGPECVQVIYAIHQNTGSDFSHLILGFGNINSYL
jgi:hypothetical protein